MAKGRQMKRRHRAVVVLGMHRSGTSAITRGLKGIGVHIGDRFLAAAPENPMGFWENETILGINSRVLRSIGIDWRDLALLDERTWANQQLHALRAEAAEYLHTAFASHELWGFKDPRTIRLLPFWQAVLGDVKADQSFLVVIRNPLSVSRSLLQVDNMDEAYGNLLWLVHMVPHLDRLQGERFVVVDYDEVIDDPIRQFERIVVSLSLPVLEEWRGGLADYAENFLDKELRHSSFAERDWETDASVNPLSAVAYGLLRRLACDELAPDSPQFWSAWSRISLALPTVSLAGRFPNSCRAGRGCRRRGLRGLLGGLRGLLGWCGWRRSSPR